MISALPSLEGVENNVIANINLCQLHPSVTFYEMRKLPWFDSAAIGQSIAWPETKRTRRELKKTV